MAFLNHTSETGSLDKVVLEAFACGLRVISTSASLSGLPIVEVSSTSKAIVDGLDRAGKVDSESLVSYVRENHSLQHLVPQIVEDIQNI